MKALGMFLGSAAVGAAALAVAAWAQPPAGGPPGAPPAPPQKMTFFVTSVGGGDGGKLGGLAGADAHCAKLATTAGRGDAKWVAYLSTQGPGAVNARDRIGAGPWYNARGQMIGRTVTQIHGDTIDDGRMGVAMGKNISLDESGKLVNGIGDQPNRHDMLTGTQPDGRAYPAGADKTCANWTSNGTGNAQLGHHDKQGGGGGSWNSQHPSRSCSQPDLVATGGAGLFYCFAVS